MLDVTDLSLRYGQSQILYDVAISAELGAITTLMGNNGVGKTSLLKAIAGRQPFYKGTVSVDGTPLERLTPFRAARSGIAYVPQGREVFPMMTVLENLETGYACLPKSEHAIPPEIFELFPVLKDMHTRRGGDLSGGQQQQLAIARALITKPKVLLLDEPTEGIQPNIIQQIGDALETLRAQGRMAILLVEQNADFAFRLADRICVMSRGQITRNSDRSSTTKEELLDDLSL